MIFADENKFLAVIINLLKNAVEAIETDGWIKITTEVFRDFVLITVANNGEKIPEEFIDKIFDEGLTTKNYGSGLGLYICKNNLNLMGADLLLAKSDDNSTEFQIRFPVKNA